MNSRDKAEKTEHPTFCATIASQHASAPRKITVDTNFVALLSRCDNPVSARRQLELLSAPAGWRACILSSFLILRSVSAAPLYIPICAEFWSILSFSNGRLSQSSPASRKTPRRDRCNSCPVAPHCRCSSVHCATIFQAVMVIFFALVTSPTQLPPGSAHVCSSATHCQGCVG